MYPLIKRSFDVICSALALVLFCPFLLIIALLIKREDGGPVFYRGERAGIHCKPFRIFKFRSMIVHADTFGGPTTSAEDPRVTKIGRSLRKYKLDELPQLFNVLKGEMSFVGPRPEVLSEVENYTPEERLLLSVRPGITDWASIKFNEEGEILKGATNPHQAYLEKIRPEKVRLGLEYVRKRSLLVDLQILLGTVSALFQTRTR